MRTRLLLPIACLTATLTACSASSGASVEDITDVFAPFEEENMNCLDIDFDPGTETPDINVVEAGNCISLNGGGSMATVLVIDGPMKDSVDILKREADDQDGKILTGKNWAVLCEYGADCDAAHEQLGGTLTDVS